MEYELEPESLHEEERPPEISEQHYFQGIAVGHRNTEYYLRHFDRFNSSGPGITWHWPAFFFTFLWFLYRKMWGWALLYFLLPLPFGVVMRALFVDSEKTQVIGGGIYLLIVYLIFPLFANALYYGHINKRIARVKRVVAEKEIRAQMLRADGGTSGSIVAALSLLAIAGTAVLLKSFALPEYYAYKSRAMVEQVIATAVGYQRLVESYAERWQQWPRNLNELGGLPSNENVFIDRVLLKNGTLYFRFTSEPPLTGKSLMLIPEVTEGGYVMWTCRGLDIANRYLPPGCYSGR